MAHGEDAYGQRPEVTAYETDVTPEPTLVELDEPWQPPHERTGPGSWPSILPPGALALAAGATALVALLGNGIGTSYAYVLKFALSGADGSGGPAHTALNVQFALSGLAIVLGLAAVAGTRSVVTAPRWTRDVAIAAILVGVVAAGVHWTLLQSLDNYKVPSGVVITN